MSEAGPEPEPIYEGVTGRVDMAGEIVWRDREINRLEQQQEKYVHALQQTVDYAVENYPDGAFIVNINPTTAEDSGLHTPGLSLEPEVLALSGELEAIAMQTGCTVEHTGDGLKATLPFGSLVKKFNSIEKHEHLYLKVVGETKPDPETGKQDFLDAAIFLDHRDVQVIIDYDSPEDTPNSVISVAGPSREFLEQ